MKRAELAGRTGYSERHLSRIAADIPGVEFSPGGQAKFDEANPELQRWIAEAQTRKENKAVSRAMPRKRRLSKMPTMLEDLEAIARFVDAFKECQASGAKVRFTAKRAEFPEVCSLAQWRAVMKMLKHTGELPPADRMKVLHHYFGQSPPGLIGELAAAFMDPMFAAWTGQEPCPHE